MTELRPCKPERMPIDNKEIQALSQLEFKARQVVDRSVGAVPKAMLAQKLEGQLA